MKYRIAFSRFEAASFVTGFSLLTFELAAARVLAPTIGSSTYVWTSVIGVIIAALAGGFWAGGKLADSRNRASDLALLLCFASLTTLFTLLFYPTMLASLAGSEEDVRIVAVYAALVLFAPTSFIIGMTSPYIAKLSIRSLQTTGRRIASIDALNSIGGIVGTFLTGFVLFGLIGSRQTFVVVILVLLAISWIIVPSYRWTYRLFFSASVIVASLLLLPHSNTEATIDTPSAHYEVQRYITNDGVMIRGLTTGPGGIQSAVRIDGDSTPVFWYAQKMAEVAVREQPERILVLGGGAFTLPQYLAESLPESSIDVVEIDPELLTISRQYFDYNDPENVNEVFTDARTFVNQSTRTYDLVLVDVYGDASIPFSLMTSEFGNRIGDMVADDGILIANIIAGIEGGPCQEVLRAMNGVYRQKLPFAYYRVDNARFDHARTNIIAMYSRSSLPYGTQMPLSTMHGSIYTDNYAPAELLYHQCQRSAV